MQGAEKALKDLDLQLQALARRFEVSEADLGEKISDALQNMMPAKAEEPVVPEENPEVIP